jgi:hypothetical protein
MGSCGGYDQQAQHAGLDHHCPLGWQSVWGCLRDAQSVSVVPRPSAQSQQNSRDRRRRQEGPDSKLCMTDSINHFDDPVQRRGAADPAPDGDSPGG